MPAASADNTAEKADIALRLSVINTFHFRHLLVTIYGCFAAKVATPPFGKMKAARVIYTSKTKGKNGHGLGPPDSFGLAALVFEASAALQAGASASKAEAVAACDAYLKEFPPGSLAAQAVVSCWDEKMRDDSTRRLHMCIMGWTDAQTRQILDIMSAHLFIGSEPLLGPRRPGALEEKAYKLLGPR